MPQLGLSPLTPFVCFSASFQTLCLTRFRRTSVLTVRPHNPFCTLSRPSLTSSPMASNLTLALQIWIYLMIGPLIGLSPLRLARRSSPLYKLRVRTQLNFCGPSAATFCNASSRLWFRQMVTFRLFSFGHTSLCVQGIFGSGKTYSASLLLVLTCAVLRLPCVLTAEPNLPGKSMKMTMKMRVNRRVMRVKTQGLKVKIQVVRSTISIR